MKNKTIVIGLIVVLLGGGFIFRFTHLTTVKEAKTAGAKSAVNGEGKEIAEGKEGAKRAAKSVLMAADIQQKNGVVLAVAKKTNLGGTITATGKVEADADRIAHVSPRIPGKIVTVRASLGDRVSAGQPLAVLDSVELGEALSRYRQAKTKVTLAQSNMERVKKLVEKKIAARKEILQAETDYQMVQTEMHTDEERLSLYGVSRSELVGGSRIKPLLPVRSPIGGIVTEKHAIVGELSDPSKSLYTVADLSTVWVLVDINEKELAKVHKGQSAMVSVGAFPDLKLKGRITYIADLVDEATRTVKARVEVVNAGRKLKPEMFAIVELALPAQAPPVLAVSEEAIQELDGKKILFVTANGTEFVPRVVELGLSSGGMVEITAGVREGERYAVKGSFLLKSELKKGELGEE